MTTVRELAGQRGIARLCHLTPYRNLLQIAQGDGLRSVADLSSDERAAFDPQDLERLDGYPDHISCSIQYPNVWYLRSRQRNATPLQRLFPDWVCVLVDPAHLWREGTLMCHRNAAAAYGAYVRTGAEGFAAMYADPVNGSRGPITRAGKPCSCPTDDQAEVLVPKAIPFADASHVVVADEAQAQRVYVGLDVVGAPVGRLRWSIAPEFFEISLSTMLRSGNLPTELSWNMEAADATA